MNRGDFLKSKFEDNKNKFNLSIPIQPRHRIFFEEIAAKFRPAAKLQDDIKALVTQEDLNLCVDKNLLIFYQGDGYKLNTLKFYLFLNFLSNWKTYNEYISSLVPKCLVPIESDTKLIVESASLAEISELRFRMDNEENKQRLSYLYNRVDILFLTISYGSRLFDGDFFKELYRVIVDIRSNQGLVTVLIFPGTEKSYKERGYEQLFYDFCIKTINMTNTKIVGNTAKKKKPRSTYVEITDEEVF